MGSFANAEEKNGSGYAQPGLTFEVGYTSKGLDKPIGFVFMLRYNNFGYDFVTAIANHQKMQGETWSGDAPSWKTFSLFAGLNTAFKISSRVHLKCIGCLA